ncbi:hypothetical protein GOV06_01310 [Candidatus Woesearchaeota archaeon]|nr:hypothetical protein [Candidatus Woesearchaeota archaeon]
MKYGKLSTCENYHEASQNIARLRRKLTKKKNKPLHALNDKDIVDYSDVFINHNSLVVDTIDDYVKMHNMNHYTSEEYATHFNWYMLFLYHPGKKVLKSPLGRIDCKNILEHLEEKLAAVSKKERLKALIEIKRG